MNTCDYHSLSSDEIDLLYLLNNKYLNFSTIFEALNTYRPFPPISKLEILVCIYRLLNMSAIKIKRPTIFTPHKLLFSITLRGSTMISERELFYQRLQQKKIT